MKNYLLVLATMLFLTAGLKAQNMSIGGTAGFGHSWTNAETGSLDKRFHASYNLGARLVYSFESNWGVSADVKFSSEGMNAGEDADNKTVLRLNYIRVPLQGIYFFGKYGERIRPKVFLGPSFGFLVGGKSTVYSNGNEMLETKAKEVAKSLDFGAIAGAGLNLRIAPATWLNADLSYYHGFANIAETGDMKNRNIGINIGVTFPLATLRPEKISQ